jgi:predicted PurR-regulated permease PerM
VTVEPAEQSDLDLTSEPDPGEAIASRTAFRLGLAGALGVLLVAAAALLAYSVRDLLLQIAVATFIAVSLDPAVRWLVRHRLARSAAVAIIFVGFAAVVAGLIWLAVPPLFSQATTLTSDFPGYLDSLRARSPWLVDIETRFNLRTSLDHFAATFLDRVRTEGLAFGQRLLGAMVNALLIIALTIYIMADLPRLRRRVVRLFPPRHRPRASEAVNVMVDKVGAYMIGNLVISLIAGGTSFVAMAALGVKFALPLAVFVALTDLIPLIGATLGAIVCIVVAAATTELWPGAIVLTLFFLLYQQLENYLIAPRVLRGSVDMSSLAVLLAALVGASVLGLVGALMAIPVAAAIKTLATPIMRAREVGAPVGPGDDGGPPVVPAQPALPGLADALAPEATPATPAGAVPGGEDARQVPA